MCRLANALRYDEGDAAVKEYEEGDGEESDAEEVGADLRAGCGEAEHFGGLVECALMRACARRLTREH